MTRNLCVLMASLMTLAVTVPARAAETWTAVTADTTTILLDGPNASWSILVSGKTSDGRSVDLTRDAIFSSANVNCAIVSPAGVVRSKADGTTNIQIEAGGKTVTVAVRVANASRPIHYNFENDIVPILSRFGCNASGCHGKAEGQNGFKLSVFGFDPPADLSALTKESRGRRVQPSAPEESLLLRKASGGMPHGGGIRVPRRSDEYETLRGWIAAGAPFGDPHDPKIETVRVEPRERLLAMHGKQQLRVIARYSDGREADVTAHARFQSNNEGLAAVDQAGLVAAGEVPGDVAIMAAYMNCVDVFRAVVPRTEKIEHYPDTPTNNFIDPLVFAKLRKLNIVPSDLADDAEYMRRVYLDVIGTLPTPEEARRFLADKRPDRRAQLVEELLRRPEFADYWALKWADLLRVDRQALGSKRAYAYYRWIHTAVEENRPVDRFARELLTAEGPLGEVAPASFFKVFPRPGDTASAVSQVFLGVRIACAECHHHPFDRWSTEDYYGMTAFFAPVSVRTTPGGEMVMAEGTSVARNPRSGASILAHTLGSPSPEELPSGDRRRRLAEWITSPENPYFARNVVNRACAHFLGRGLVEPVDDVRATNPPSNPELLDALAREFVAHGHDFHWLVRNMTASRVYQLSSKPNATNGTDEQNYSRALLKRVDAEVLFDMVCQTTGVPERFSGVPVGTRAIQLWDSRVGHYFLKLYGRPVRLSSCECERHAEPGVSQVLHLLNSPEIHDKMSHDRGTVARLTEKDTADGPLIEDLYLTYFSRLPDAKEREVAMDYLHKHTDKRRQAAEDLAWSMMNSLEFVFNH